MMKNLAKEIIGSSRAAFVVGVLTMITLLSAITAATIVYQNPGFTIAWVSGALSLLAYAFLMRLAIADTKTWATAETAVE